jgi:endoglucanase
MRIIAFLLLITTSALGQYRRGVNVSGGEFGMSHIPGVFGTDYTFNSEKTFQYFSDRNLGLFRVQVLWERLQPVLQGPLDSVYLSRLKSNVAWAKAHGGEVIVDIQNFARYSFNVNGQLQTYVIDNPAADGTVKVSTADFADLWVRLSNEFKFERAVYAYDLMNEPHDMGKGDWRAISQTALSVIRANQDDKLVLVPGNSYSSANRWVSSNGTTPWIQDPANNFAYEAHNYFDSNESGSYALTYDQELKQNSDLANIGKTRVQHFIDWCHSNNVRGIVDEYGIPDSDPRWATVLDNFLAALDAAGMDGGYWAAGEWWGTYPLSVQPTASFTVDRPQMTTLLAHSGHGFLTALSSASISVARAASGSFVTVYGTGFTDQTAVPASLPYPATLADITVQVTDAAGGGGPAGLLYVSPGQINILMPPQLAEGRATMVVARAGNPVASGTITVAATGPAVFTTNSAGYGLAAAQVIRVKADGSFSYEPVAQFDAAQNAIVPAPIDFGAASDQLILVLYGTGVRGSSFSARIGGTDAPVTYAGPQGQYPGLDQVNVPLPRSLAGSGQVNVVLKADGVAANSVALVFK